MASEKSTEMLSDALKSRRRLYVEGRKLMREVAIAQQRLSEIDREEERLSEVIDQCGGIIAAAHAGSPEEQPARLPGEQT
jgi:hypothetical protein